MLAQIFHLDFSERSQTDVQGQQGQINAFDFKTLQEVLGKVQPCSGDGNGPFFAGVNGLEPVTIFWLGITGHVTGKRSLSQLMHRLHELFVGAVEQEAQGSTS